MSEKLILEWHDCHLWHLLCDSTTTAHFVHHTSLQHFCIIACVHNSPVLDRCTVEWIRKGITPTQLHRTSTWLAKKQLKPTHDQLKTISNQQPCFKTYLTSICSFFQQGCQIWQIQTDWHSYMLLFLFCLGNYIWVFKIHVNASNVTNLVNLQILQLVLPWKSSF